VETPDVIDLRKTQRKEPEKPLYHVSLALLHRHLTCRSKARKQQVFLLHVYFWCCGLLTPQEFLMSDAGFGGEGGTHSARDHYGCKSHVTFLLI
jgi:hypothetical protein